MGKSKNPVLMAGIGSKLCSTVDCDVASAVLSSSTTRGRGIYIKTRRQSTPLRIRVSVKSCVSIL
jgi:hypothetical protein